MFYCKKEKTNFESNTIITYIPSGTYMPILLYLHIHQYASNYFFVVLSTHFYCCFSITTRETFEYHIYIKHAGTRTHTQTDTIPSYYIFLWMSMNIHLKTLMVFQLWFSSNIMKQNLVYFSFKYYLVF